MGDCRAHLWQIAWVATLVKIQYIPSTSELNCQKLPRRAFAVTLCYRGWHPSGRLNCDQRFTNRLLKNRKSQLGKTYERRVKICNWRVDSFYGKLHKSQLGLTLTQVAPRITIYAWARNSCLSIRQHSLITV